MSESAAQPSSRSTTTIAECAAWRRRVRAGDTRSEIARGSRFSVATVGKHVRGGEGCGHDVENVTGVAPVRMSESGGPGGSHPASKETVEAVCDALEERLDENLGDTVFVRAGHLARDDPIPAVGQQVTAALCVLGDEGRRGLTVERTNPEANRARWAVRREGGER